MNLPTYSDSVLGFCRVSAILEISSHDYYAILFRSIFNDVLS
jgi:hypothetical protein